METDLQLTFGNDVALHLAIVCCYHMHLYFRFVMKILLFCCFCHEGGSLVSIGGPDEQQFIQSNMEIFKDTDVLFWIGLFENHDGIMTFLKFFKKKKFVCFLSKTVFTKI